MDRDYLKRCVLYLLAVLVSLFMAFYVGYHIYRFFFSEISTQSIAEVSRSDILRCDGYVMRYENAVSCSSGGVSLPVFADGAHVSSGSQIATLYKSDDNEKAEEIRELIKQLDTLKKYRDSVSNAKNASAIDDKIHSLMISMKSLTDENDISGALQMTSTLLCELNRRSVVTGVGGGDFDTLISSVSNQIESKKSELGRALEAVYTNETGWYFSECDGYEAVFNPELIDSMTIDGFKEISETEPVTVNNAGKLVTDFKWYVFVITETQNLGSLCEGDKTSVTFNYNSDTELTMRVERIVTEIENDECVIVFSSTVMPEGFSYYRSQPIEIVTETVTGLSVPKSAVRIVDGQMGVYTFDGIYSTFTRIEPIREYDDIYIVNAEPESVQEDEDDGIPYLSYNDIIITEGKDVFNNRIYY